MAEPLKNALSPDYIKTVAKNFKQKDSKFPVKKFVNNVLNSGWQDLQLKQRWSRISRCLAEALPSDFKQALPILLEVAPQYSGYQALFFPEFVATYGMARKHETISLKALKNLTQYSSSEFAIRPFILRDPEKIMNWMLKQSVDKNYHVRRLASEGCRPRLPWAQSLPEFKKDPRLILPILTNLQRDPELYVQKSVGNNINDIGKDHPSIALKLARQWLTSSPAPSTKWIVNRGLRNLVKEGNPKALSLLGFGNAKNLKAQDIQLSKSNIMLGESLRLETSLENLSSKPQKVMIDYIIHHFKKRGQHSEKVFKWKNIELKPRERVTLEKMHKFKEISTRKYYSGPHLVQLQINGSRYKEKRFTLKVTSD